MKKHITIALALLLAAFALCLAAFAEEGNDRRVVEEEYGVAYTLPEGAVREKYYSYSVAGDDTVYDLPVVTAFSGITTDDIVSFAADFCDTIHDLSPDMLTAMFGGYDDTVCISIDASFTCTDETHAGIAGKRMSVALSAETEENGVNETQSAVLDIFLFERDGMPFLFAVDNDFTQNGGIVTPEMFAALCDTLELLPVDMEKLAEDDAGIMLEEMNQVLFALKAANAAFIGEPQDDYRFEDSEIGLAYSMPGTMVQLSPSPIPYFGSFDTMFGGNFENIDIAYATVYIMPDDFALPQAGEVLDREAFIGRYPYFAEDSVLHDGYGEATELEARRCTKSGFEGMEVSGITMIADQAVDTKLFIFPRDGYYYSIAVMSNRGQTDAIYDTVTGSLELLPVDTDLSPERVENLPARVTLKAFEDAAAENDYAAIKTVTVGGKTVTAPTPYHDLYHTMLPVRAVCEAMGYTVGWNEEWEEVTVLASDRTIRLRIGRAFCYYSYETGSELREPPRTVDLSCAVELIEPGYTMAPIEFFTMNFTEEELQKAVPLIEALING